MAKKDRNFIPKAQIDSQKKLVFSFEYYDTCSDKYCLSKFNSSDISTVTKRLQQLNSKTLREIFSQGKVLHFHEVDWNKTIKKNGFPNSMANRMSPFQFSLNGINNQKARVYGAYGSEVFYIVWFDLNHEIWPSFKKNT